MEDALKTIPKKPVKNRNTKIIEGFYRGKRVTHYYNKKTNINVIKDAKVNFLSAWKLNPAERRIVLESPIKFSIYKAFWLC